MRRVGRGVGGAGVRHGALGAGAGAGARAHARATQAGGRGGAGAGSGAGARATQGFDAARWVGRVGATPLASGHG